MNRDIDFILSFAIVIISVIVIVLALYAVVEYQNENGNKYNICAPDPIGYTNTNSYTVQGNCVLFSSQKICGTYSISNN